jgi:hypothetical protein
MRLRAEQFAAHNLHADGLYREASEVVKEHADQSVN